MAKKKQQDRFVSQAAQQALVRFGPELSGLQELMREAADQRATTIAQAQGGSAAIGQAVQAAAPKVAGIYERAGLDQARVAHTLVGQDLAGLGGVANSIKAGASLEAGAMADRLAESQASALTELQMRGVQAREGANFAVQNAQRQYRQDVSKVQARAQDLAQEQGAFTAATAGQLRQDSADRALRLRIERLGNAQSERNSLRSSGIDPDTGKPIPGGKLDPATKKPKFKLESPEKHDKQASYLSTLAHEASIAKNAAEKKGLSGKAARRYVVQQMTTEQPATKFWTNAKDPKKVRYAPPPTREKSDWVEQTVPAMPSRPADVWMTAALDSVFDGGLSRKTQERLQKNYHYSVKDLGFGGGGSLGMTASERRRAMRGRRPASPAQVSDVGSALRGLLGN